MAELVDLVAETREDSGKGASRRLRRAGKVPAIVYGAGREPRAVTFDADSLLHKMENESFFSSVLNVKIGKNNRKCDGHRLRTVLMVRSVATKNLQNLAIFSLS